MFTEDEDTDASVSDSIDPELVNANGSDSSGEGKIVAHSIDGEEGMVDIAMTESSNGVDSTDADADADADAEAEAEADADADASKPEPQPS